MNIVILGFMATGKTSVAKELSNRLGMKYISTDELIEKEEKRTIPQIFKEYGEPYFRKLERKVVKQISKIDNLVIDTGGGVVLNEDNIKDLRKNGILFCLKANPEIILRRTQKDSYRPLLRTNDKLSRIEELLQERQPYYNKIENSIDTSNMTIQRVVEKIIRILKSRK
jgi:shikimate kinase